jgi:hypothetical protein
MRLVGMVVALILVARFAPAQASVEQLARCAAIPAAALRLQCYDTLAKHKSDSSSGVEGDDIVPTGFEIGKARAGTKPRRASVARSGPLGLGGDASCHVSSEMFPTGRHRPRPMSR